MVNIQKVGAIKRAYCLPDIWHSSYSTRLDMLLSKLARLHLPNPSEQLSDQLAVAQDVVEQTWYFAQLDR
jgi:hypothetical protein